MPASNPLYPPLPHFFSGYTLSVVYESDPEIIRELLPEPLEPDPRNLVVLNVEDWRWTMPVGPLMESGVWILAKYKNIHGSYLPFMYEDSDGALAAGREMFGYPKKFAKVSLTFGGQRIGSGEQVNDLGGAREMMTGVVNRCGINLYRINVALTEKAERTDELLPGISFGEGTINLRIIPNVDNKPLIQDLTFFPHTAEDRKISEAWRGPATISFEESPSDPIYKLKPIRVLGGVYQRVDEMWLRGGKILHKYI